MTSQKTVVFLLALAGLLSAAFNVNEYLFPEEKNATVNYTNFTLNGTSYSIVKINGTDTFLLKSGNVVIDGTEVESVIYAYYSRQYYPNVTELDALKGAIKKFNESRNDGYDFKNKEEYICRDDILLSNGKITVSGQPVRCVDNESCTKNALLLFSVYGEGLGLGSPSVLIQPLMDFTPSSLRMDDLLDNYTLRLNNLSESTVSDTLNYIKDTSPELEPLSKKIEASIFRTPRLNDTKDRKDCEFKCFAICPSFDLDQDAAADITDQASSLAEKVAPLAGYKASSESLFNKTQERLLYVKNEDTAAYYNTIFTPLNASGTEAIGLASEALGHVQNKSLSDKLDSLKSLHATIPEDIDSRNFTGLDADLETYKNLSSEVMNASLFLLGEYNQTLNAKNIANSLVLVLESKDLDPVSMKSLELIKNQSTDLDAEFRDGLTLAQLKALEENYTEVSESAQELLKSESDTPATRVLLLFRGFARKVNTGIADVADSTKIIPKSEVPDNPLTLALVSVLFFLAGMSATVLLFLYIISTVRFVIPKTTHILGSAFFCIILLMFVFTIFMFLFLTKTSTDATLPEFLADFGSKNSTSIVLDLRNASFEDAKAMRSCAMTLADSFEARNKTWSMYALTPNTCTLTDSGGANTSLSVDGCLSDIEEAPSSFHLQYAQKNLPPRFSVIYENKAEIKANLDYYDSCPLVALFS
jgi:hypothetical protein